MIAWLIYLGVPALVFGSLAIAIAVGKHLSKGMGV